MVGIYAEASRQFLRKFSQSGIGFLDRIITTDEIWFHYYDPETKQQSNQWKNVDSPLYISILTPGAQR
jgi:hypothetical protein